MTPIQQEMDRWFEDFFGNGGRVAATIGDISPSLDVWETKDALCAKVEVPGMDPKEIDINVSGDVLSLSGEKKSEELTETDNYLLRERSYGTFRRSFRLPSWANPEKVDAQYKNGTLELTIARRESARQKTVQVKVKS